MAISDDLRSVRTMLGSLRRNDENDVAEAGLLQLLSDNLASLADQVEALEAVPLAPEQPFFMKRPRLAPALSGDAPWQ